MFIVCGVYTCSLLQLCLCVAKPSQARGVPAAEAPTAAAQQLSDIQPQNIHSISVLRGEGRLLYRTVFKKMKLKRVLGVGK